MKPVLINNIVVGSGIGAADDTDPASRTISFDGIRPPGGKGSPKPFVGSNGLILGLSAVVPLASLRKVRFARVRSPLTPPDVVKGETKPFSSISPSVEKSTIENILNMLEFTTALVVSRMAGSKAMSSPNDMMGELGST